MGKDYVKKEPGDDVELCTCYSSSTKNYGEEYTKNGKIQAKPQVLVVFLLTQTTFPSMTKLFWSFPFQ